MSPRPGGTVDSPVPGIRGGLQVAAASAMGLAAVGAVTHGRVGRACAAGAVAIIVGAPLLRVMALVGHWYRGHDRRFAVVGVALLLVVAGGAALAALPT